MKSALTLASSSLRGISTSGPQRHRFMWRQPPVDTTRLLPSRENRTRAAGESARVHRRSSSPRDRFRHDPAAGRSRPKSLVGREGLCSAPVTNIRLMTGLGPLRGKQGRGCKRRLGEQRGARRCHAGTKSAPQHVLLVVVAESGSGYDRERPLMQSQDTGASAVSANTRGRSTGSLAESLTTGPVKYLPCRV
jgi:hypothetical protein